jgi:hypothetical protein
MDVDVKNLTYLNLIQWCFEGVILNYMHCIFLYEIAMMSLYLEVLCNIPHLSLGHYKCSLNYKVV